MGVVMSRIASHICRRIRFRSWAVVLAIVLVNTCLQASPPLPPESQLPDTAFPIPTPDPNDGKPTVAPNEAVLPGESGNQKADTDEGSEPVPDESALPLDKNESDAVDGVPVEAGLAGLRPWLRLDLKGHTGIIRTLAAATRVDSRRGDSTATLVTAGEDKDVHVWQRSELTENQWVHRRTIRWPIQRGPRGRIYSVAIRAEHVALAGHGATGGLGEIWIVNALTGELIRSLVQGDNGQAHRQTVASLRWSPSTGKTRLASVDVEGRVMIWQPNADTGLWSGRELVNHDIATYGQETAEALRARRRFVPLTFLGSDQIVVAKYVGLADQPSGAAKWQLVRIHLDSGQTVVIQDSELIEFVIALDASEDGRTLVASDAMGTTRRFRFGDDGQVISAVDLDGDGLPLFVDVHPDGHRALVGGVLLNGQNKPAKNKPGQVEFWDLEPDVPTLLSTLTLNSIPPAGVHASSPLADNLGQAIVASSNRIEIHTIDQAGKLKSTPDQLLQTDTGAVTKVAFTNQNETYSIAIARDGEDFADQFDLSKVKLLGRQPIDSAQLVPSQRLGERWTVRREDTKQGPRYRLFQGDQPCGQLPIVPELHGEVTSVATMPNPSPESDQGAVVVGTSSRNEIYVFAADDRDPPTLLRHFRGHTGDVNSTSVSADGRYLVSGSADTTVNVWNLEGLFSLDRLQNLWGVQFEVESDVLIAASVREDGPLHFRGVRSGDQLLSIRWANRVGDALAESDPAKMRTLLGTLPFDTLVVFQWARRGRPLAGFQSFAAWRPLTTLTVDRTREWAFWTPAGFYDASFNGHRRFGWQINRGVDSLPDFYRAAQFRKSLERPDVMQRLLQMGNLSAAMRASTSGIDAPPGDTAIVNQIKTKPIIRIIQPISDDTIEDDTLTVRAEIDVPAGGELVAPRAYLGGVPAVQATTVSQTLTQVTVDWKFQLPHRRNLHVEVLAATEAEAVGRATVSLQRRLPEQPPRTPRLHLLAIGVGDYRDPQIQSLDFAGRATEVVANMFRTQSSSVYRVSADQLVDRDATGPLWRVYAKSAAERLAKDVGPDDLVVMYMCGHGLRDRRTNRWYFVTADAKYRDLMNDQYQDCMSEADLAVFSKLPCTKLAILDSCHSGAVQTSMRPDDLKSALRFLQEDVVITWTASEGHQEAAEQRENRLGRFTNHLTEALSGKADENGDGIVTLQEAIKYVSNRVSEESESEGKPQHPTAGPTELIEQIELPLSKHLRSTARAAIP